MVPSMLLFLDISGGELTVIALVIFIVLGPDKIPEVARKFGKAMRFIRKATDDIKREINIDEDLIQKPRSYNYTKKTTPVDKNVINESPAVEQPKETSPIDKNGINETPAMEKEDQNEEPKDNKTAN